MQVKMRRAVKYRMYPNKAQAQLIDRTIGCARFIYNQMLETRITTYKATGETCNPTPAQYKDRFPFLREVDSLALAGAQMRLFTAYRNFFRTPGRVGFPKFKTKHRSRQTYTTYRVGNNIVLNEGGKRLKLPKVGRNNNRTLLNRGAHGDSLLILVSLEALSKKPPPLTA